MITDEIIHVTIFLSDCFSKSLVFITISLAKFNATVFSLVTRKVLLESTVTQDINLLCEELSFHRTNHFPVENCLTNQFYIFDDY